MNRPPRRRRRDPGLPPDIERLLRGLTGGGGWTPGRVDDAGDGPGQGRPPDARDGHGPGAGDVRGAGERHRRERRARHGHRPQDRRAEGDVARQPRGPPGRRGGGPGGQACGSTPSPPGRQPPACRAPPGAGRSGSRRRCRCGPTSSSRSPRVSPRRSGRAVEPARPAGGSGSAPGPARPGCADAPADARVDVLDAARPGDGDAGGRGADRLRGVAPARRRSHGGAHARRVRSFAEGLGGRRAPGPPVPRRREVPGCGCSAPCRGWPRAAGGGSRLRRRHQHRHRRHRGGRPLHRPVRPRGGPEALQRAHVRPQQSTGAEGRPRPARRRCSPSSKAGRRRQRPGDAGPPPRPMPSARPSAVAGTGGPAEKAFGALVGLELRPCACATPPTCSPPSRTLGRAARDAAWRHPTCSPRRTSTTRSGTSSGPALPRRRDGRRARPPAQRRGPGVTRTPGTNRQPDDGRHAYALCSPTPRTVLERVDPRRGQEPAARLPRGTPGARRGSPAGGPPAHLTASCVVLDPTGEHVLLTLHRQGPGCSSSAATSRR